MTKKHFILIFGLIGLIPISAIAQSGNNTNANLHNLVILQYHHVAEDTPAITSISPKDFEAHMAFLSKNYNVVDLGEALENIKNKKAMKDKSIAITFDDGYLNILENAHPILKKYEFPYTIFINPGIIGQSKSQLSWSQIKSMQDLATFANHTMDHDHLLDKRDYSDEKSWLKAKLKDVNTAEQILKKQLGYSKKWLAYPFGEFNNALKNALAKDGYISFGQQSGAVSYHSDFAALPRFPAAGIYANLDSLQTKMASLAMPANLVKPKDTEFASGAKLDSILLQIQSDDLQIANFACYFKSNKLQTTPKGKRIEIKLNHDLKAGRARVNCTAPSKTLSGRFYWYSVPMFTPTENGRFPD